MFFVKLKKYRLSLVFILFIISFTSLIFTLNKFENMPKTDIPYTYKVTTKYKEQGSNLLFGIDSNGKEYKTTVTNETYINTSIGEDVTFSNYEYTGQALKTNILCWFFTILSIILFGTTIIMSAIKLHED